MKCEHCGEDITTKYGSGRFCSARCARLFSSLHCCRSDFKLGMCKICGKTVEVHKTSQKLTICQECKNEIKRQIPCKVCGQLECKNPICHTANISKTIDSLHKYFNLDSSKKGTVEIFDEIIRIKNILEHLYYTDKLSTVEIAKKYNCRVHIVYNAFRNFGIRIRNNHNANILAMLEGRLNVRTPSYNFYKTEWHKTWDGREVFLRSSYETDYANILDSEKIYYEVENLRIKYFDTQLNEYRCAVPDFYIPSTNTIVEIKSNYTLNLQNMKDKFKAYQEQGYNTRLVLDHKDVDIETLNFSQ